MNNFKMLTEVVQQYKNLTSKSEKFFYYAYGKMDIKIQAIKKELHLEDANLEDMQYKMFIENELNSIYVNYEEIQEVLKMNRINTTTLKGLETQLRKDSSIVVETEEGKRKTIFIYKSLEFDSKNKRIEVTFNEQVLLLFQQIRTQPYCNIIIKDLANLKDSYELKLYLYMLPMLRGNKGYVTKDIEEIRVSISNSDIDDYNFYSRFIKKPSDRINKNKELTYGIKPERHGDKIKFNVFKKGPK